MKHMILILASVFGFSALAEGYACRATYRKFSEDKVTEQVEKPLTLVQSNAAFQRFEVEINDRSLIANIDLQDQNVLLSIVKAPTYTNGINSRTNIGQNGRVSTSQIESEVKLSVIAGPQGPEAQETETGFYTLYRVECYAQ